MLKGWHVINLACCCFALGASTGYSEGLSSLLPGESDPEAPELIFRSAGDPDAELTRLIAGIGEPLTLSIDFGESIGDAIVRRCGPNIEFFKIAASVLSSINADPPSDPLAYLFDRSSPVSSITVPACLAPATNLDPISGEWISGPLMGDPEPRWRSVRAALDATRSDIAEAFNMIRSDGLARSDNYARTPKELREAIGLQTEPQRPPSTDAESNNATDRTIGSIDVGGESSWLLPGLGVDFEELSDFGFGRYEGNADSPLELSLENQASPEERFEPNELLLPGDGADNILPHAWNGHLGDPISEDLSATTPEPQTENDLDFWSQYHGTDNAGAVQASPTDELGSLFAPPIGAQFSQEALGQDLAHELRDRAQGSDDLAMVLGTLTADEYQSHATERIDAYVTATQTPSPGGGTLPSVVSAAVEDGTPDELPAFVLKNQATITADLDPIECGGAVPASRSSIDATELLRRVQIVSSMIEPQPANVMIFDTGFPDLTPEIDAALPENNRMRITAFRGVNMSPAALASANLFSVNAAIPSIDGTPPAEFSESPWHGLAVAFTAVGGPSLQDMRDNQLLPARVAIVSLLNGGSDPAIQSVSLLNAMDLAAMNEVDVINASFIFPSMPETNDYILDVLGQDMLMVAAAGNYGDLLEDVSLYPAKNGGQPIERAHVVTVAMLDAQASGRHIRSSVGSDFVDLFAPGCLVTSFSLNENGALISYDWSGTSFAAPQVTLAASILSSFGLPPRDIKRRLFQSVNFNPDWMDDVFSSGSLNLENAVSITHDVVEWREAQFSPELPEIGSIAQIDGMICDRRLTRGDFARVSVRGKDIYFWLLPPDPSSERFTRFKHCLVDPETFIEGTFRSVEGDVTIDLSLGRVSDIIFSMM